MQALMQQGLSAYKSCTAVDVSTFDFSSLQSTIEPGRRWHLSVKQETSGKPDVVHDRVRGRNQYNLCCNEAVLGQRMVPGEVITGIPKPNDVLDFVKRCFAAPFPPFQPGLPAVLCLSVEYQPYMPTLEPFLNTLPFPFKWALDEPELADETSAEVFKGQDFLFSAYIALAEYAKETGNKAFAAKDRARAVEAYSDALKQLDGSVIGLRTPEFEERSKKRDHLGAVISANRAAAYLLDGEGRDPSRALHDGLMAADMNPDYVKSYHRQARAYELLGEQGKARDVIKRALRRPALASSKELFEMLKGMQG
ncbi:hypothetical protein BV25DRAFT_1913195 [Artomyces pyxidatus]|uniref:Uncharacterized protein n=1 Tax=Artomyces pyxidatus TaxID=48021 RepID=A0ACB8TAY1_9AGAM|nr:hypothetical protein BV25DRAFT_1913195 [Artomyces pyxidatus]